MTVKPALALVPLLLMTAVGAAFAIGLRRDPHILPSMLIDRPLPSFSLPALKPGDPEFLSAEIAGEVALINVFGSWCGACRVEHPTLMRLSAKGDARIYGVDWKDAPEDGRAWLDAFGDPFIKVGLDHDSRLAIEFGVTGAPETFVVDRSGRIRYKQIGPITDDVWRDTIAPIVADLEKEPAP